MWFWSQLDARDGLRLTVVVGPAGIRRVLFGDAPRPEGHWSDTEPLVAEARSQLQAYFAGDLRRFELPLDPVGTDFQRRVWLALREIPYGETRSYSYIAAEVGAPRAVRAVGAANGRNPIPVIVPCHRVIGANGELVGFGGGLPLKKLLLDLEAHYANPLREAAAR